MKWRGGQSRKYLKFRRHFCDRRTRKLAVADRVEDIAILGTLLSALLLLTLLDTSTFLLEWAETNWARLLDRPIFALESTQSAPYIWNH